MRETRGWFPFDKAGGRMKPVRFLGVLLVLLALLAGCQTERQTIATPTVPASVPKTVHGTTPTTVKPSANSEVRATPTEVTGRPATGVDIPKGRATVTPSWQKLTAAPSGVQALATALDNPSLIFAVGDGIYRSTDSGIHWTEIRGDVKARSVVLGSHGRQILVGGTVGCARGQPGPVWRSLDGGVSWQQLGQTDLTGWAIDPSDEKHIFAGTCGGLVQSVDAGETWTRAKIPVLGDDGFAVAVGPGGQRVVVALASEGGTIQLVSSIDGGATFVSLRTPALSAPASLAVSANDRFTVASPKLVAATPDGGKSWTPLTVGLGGVNVSGGANGYDLGPLRANPRVQSILYLATGSGLLRYGPNTNRWEQLGEGLSQPVKAFDVSIDADRTVFYVATGSGLYRLVVSR